MDRNETPLDLLVEASHRERLFFPMVPKDAENALVYAWSFSVRCLSRDMLRALNMRAGMRFEAGEHAKVWQDVLACHRLARLMGQDPTIVCRLVALAEEAIATHATTRLATSGRLSAKEAKSMLADLEALGPMPGFAECIDRLERCSALDCMIEVAQGKVSAKEFMVSGDEEARMDWSWAVGRLDIDEMLRTANAYYDEILRCRREPTFAARQAAFVQFRVAREDGRWSAKRRDVMAPALGGRLLRPLFSRNFALMLLGEVAADVSRAGILEAMANMQLELAKLSLALAACKAEKGEYPAKLADLTPDYIKAAPKDIFSGSPVQYKRTAEGYVLWSVGDDLTDDGGAMEDPNGWCDTRPDIVVQVK